ncbi:hypothetical protein SLA2020_117130 [Shorea laevis]
MQSMPLEEEAILDLGNSNVESSRARNQEQNHQQEIKSKISPIGCEKARVTLAVEVTHMTGTTKEQDQENSIANKSKKESKDDGDQHHLQAKQQLTKEMSSNS